MPCSRRKFISKLSVYIYQTAWRQLPEEQNLRYHNNIEEVKKKT
jgi:hypothetical protein